MEITNQGLIVLIKKGEVPESFLVRIKSLQFAKEKQIEVKDQGLILIIKEGMIFKAKAMALQIEKVINILNKIKNGQMFSKDEVAAVEGELQIFKDYLWLIEDAGENNV